MLESKIVRSVQPEDLSPRQVAAGFRRLIDGGVTLHPAGEARDRPEQLLARYTPRYALRLFEASYYLTDLREDDDIRFLVAWVGLRARGRIRRLYPRVFYKDSSLIWRVATHFVKTENENWIGKGDVRWVHEDGEDHLYSAEETTNLPLEIQSALDLLSRRGGHARRDLRAVPLILRRGPEDRVEPFADFTRPRRRAEGLWRLNGGRPVARFTRPGAPESLEVAPGFEPDFARGILEVASSRSRFYGGRIRKLRILSRNREIQYQFVVAPRHAWINPPQALTTELMTYGCRTVDVEVPEDLCVPGYEFHYLDADGDAATLHTQIPAGYAGEPHPRDLSRADASRWIEALPLMRRFRREVLRSGGRLKPGARRR